MTEGHSLAIPGGTLFYKTVGQGPLLLVLQGGAVGAEGSDALARHLADRYTVLSYDRRGLSRSKLEDPSQPLGVETHADDVHRLLAAITDEPVMALGISIGALIGLDVVSRYPHQVKRLVAHEAPTRTLLSEAEGVALTKGQEEAEELFRREGIGPAMRRLLEISHVNPEDREPDVELPRPDPARFAAMAANTTFFLTHDAPAVRLYHLDVDALLRQTHRIVPAAGRTSGDALPRKCAQALSEAIGVPLVDLPGGHNAYASRPRAFSQALVQVLEPR